MKKFFKNISKKSPGKGPPGSPKLNAHTSASPAAAVIGYDVKEKDLGKLHKAAWTGDLAKVKQLAKKDPSPVDKENRYCIFPGGYYTFVCSLVRIIF